MKALRPWPTPLNFRSSILGEARVLWIQRCQQVDQEVLKGGQARASLGQRFDLFDQADEDTLNRILWHSARGGAARYPAHLAGAHGRGLRTRKLALDGRDEE